VKKFPLLKISWPLRHALSCLAPIQLAANRLLAIRLAAPVLFALVLFALAATAQQPYRPVDMEAVAANYDGPSGRMAYEQLSNRLGAGEDLSLEDYRNLYYGSAFQDAHETRDQVNTRDLAKLMSPERAGTLVARCDSILALRPADLAANYFKGLGLFLQDTLSLEAIDYRNRYAQLMEAVLSSGNGAGCGTAFQVLCAKDALETMRFLGIPGFTGDARDENCQVFRIRPSPIYEAKQIYFDMTNAAPDATNTPFEPEKAAKGKKKK